MIFSKKYKVHWQKFQKYDYYIFQLKWSLCQRTERWRERAGRQQGRVVVGPCWKCRVWQRAVTGQVLEELFFLPDWETVKWSPGGSAALWDCHLTSRGPQQRGTQWTLPHLTPLWLNRRLTGWLAIRPAGVRDHWHCKSRASKQSKANNFGVTVIFTLI